MTPTTPPRLSNGSREETRAPDTTHSPSVRIPALAVQSTLGILLALFLSGCGGEEPVPTTRDVGVPPSVAAPGEEAALGRVLLSDEQLRTLSIRTATVTREPVEFEIGLPGTGHPAPDYFAEVSSPLSGRIASMAVNEGERVASGQVVAELESLELANLAADYLETRADLEYSRSQVNRYELLVERRISPEAVLEKARADLSRARARSAAAHARLHTLGVTDAELDRWYTEEIQRPLLRIRSPLDGVIAEHLIQLGQSVTAYQQMMTVVNTERVMVRGFLSPEDASFVRPGDSVRVSLKGAPSRSVDARVTTVSPALAEGSRSVTVNVLLETAGAWPIPGQSVRLGIQAHTEEPLVALPLSAVEFEGDLAVVFVRGKDDRTWLRRAVEIARITSDQVLVSSGLEAGEAVATSQVFTLKALGRFEQFGEEG